MFSQAPELFTHVEGFESTHSCTSNRPKDRLDSSPNPFKGYRSSLQSGTILYFSVGLPSCCRIPRCIKNKRNVVAQCNQVTLLIMYMHLQIHPPILHLLRLHPYGQPLYPLCRQALLDVQV